MSCHVYISAPEPKERWDGQNRAKNASIWKSCVAGATSIAGLWKGMKLESLLVVLLDANDESITNLQFTLFFLGTDLSFPYQLSIHFDFKGKNYAVVPFPKSRSPSLISWADSWFGNSIWLNPISLQLTTWLASLLTLLKSTASMDSFAAETKLTASDTITADTLKRPRFVPSLNSFVGCG